MGDFTSRMAEDLTAYFGGALTGDMGLRSGLGSQLDQIAASAASEYGRPPEWDGWTRYDEAGMRALPDQAMAVHESRSGASADSTEAATAALSAVRQERRVRAALTAVGTGHARVLAAYFTPRPVTSPSGLESLGDVRAVVALIAGDLRARELALRATSRAAPGTSSEHRQAINAQRDGAKRELASYVRRAKKAVQDAREAFATVWPEVMRAERMERARRFVGGGA